MWCQPLGNKSKWSNLLPNLLLMPEGLPMLRTKSGTFGKVHTGFEQSSNEVSTEAGPGTEASPIRAKQTKKARKKRQKIHKPGNHGVEPGTFLNPVEGPVWPSQATLCFFSSNASMWLLWREKYCSRELVNPSLSPETSLLMFCKPDEQAVTSCTTWLRVVPCSCSCACVALTAWCNSFWSCCRVEILELPSVIQCCSFCWFSCSDWIWDSKAANRGSMAWSLTCFDSSVVTRSWRRVSTSSNLDWTCTDMGFGVQCLLYSAQGSALLSQGSDEACAPVLDIDLMCRFVFAVAMMSMERWAAAWSRTLVMEIQPCLVSMKGDGGSVSAPTFHAFPIEFLHGCNGFAFHPNRCRVSTKLMRCVPTGSGSTR